MKQRKKSFGMRISAFVLSFAMVCTLLAGLNVVAFAADDNDLIVSVHCFYNDALKGGDGEHLYTKDADEMSWLSGLPTWDDQDEAWKAPVSSSLAIYRCFNPNSGEHHYAAADEAEWLVKDMGWTQEKIAFYSDDNKGVPVYRLWNGGEGVGSHYYTTDEGEKDFLVAAYGWKFEGVNFYGVKEEEPTTKALSAAQVGSDKIMVSSEDGFTGEESFTVSHGDLVDELAGAPEYDEDLDIYTITLANPIEDATYTVSCDGYTPATFEGEVSEKEMTATQTGANEITVVSETAFNPLDEFEVSHGVVEDAVVATVFDDDMCTVTLTLDSNIVEATYTVECSDEEYEAAEFIGEEAEVTQVVFPSDLLVLSSDGLSGATAYVFTDQWGDPINDPGATFTVAPQKYAAFPTWNEETEMGTLAITSAAIMVVEDKIPVSVVYANNTKVENVVLTASASSVVSNVEVGEIVPLDEDSEGLRITNERMYAANSNSAVYALPITATDQYGLELNADKLNAMVTAQQLFVTPLNGVAKVGNFKDVDGQTYLPVYCDDVTKYGAETINFLSRSGFSTVGSFVVYPMEVIDAIDVNVGDLQVGKAVPFAFLATDQYGDLVDYTDTDLYQVTPAAGATSSTITITRLVGGNNGPQATITATYGSVFTLTADGFTLTASAQAGQTKQETLNVKTATNKISLPTAKVNEKATPAYVKEFADDAVLSYANTAATIKAVTNAATYVIIDSYGQEMSATDFTDGGYTLEVAPGSTKFTTYTQGAIQLVDALAAQAPTSPVTETYKVTIKDGTGATVSTKNVNVTVAGKIAQYAAAFVDTDQVPKAKFYVGDQMNAGSEAAILVLMGLDNKGNKINVPLDGLTIDYDEQIGASTMGCIVVAGKGMVTTNAVDTGATIVVKENAFKIYKDGSLLATATLECSNEAPEAVMVMGIADPAGTKTPVDLETGLAAQSGAAITFVNAPAGFDGKKVVAVGGGTAQVVIFALDQYGNYIDIDDAEIGGMDVDTLGGNIPATFSGKTVTLEIIADDVIEDIDVYVATQ